MTILALWLVALSSFAQTTYTWTNTFSSGYFTNTDVTWDPTGSYPQVGDTVLFTNNLNYTVFGSNSVDLFSANAFFTNTAAGAMTVTQRFGTTTWTITNLYAIGASTLADTTSTVVWASGTLAVTNSGGTGQLIVGLNSRGSFVLNSGTVIVNQLIATNNTTSLTNSFFTFNGGTLTTSNAAGAYASRIVGPAVPFSGSFMLAINGTWNMLGGTNLFTNASGPDNGYVLIGSGANAATVNVVNAVWDMNALTTQFPFTIGNGTAIGNVLNILAGGIVGVPQSTIGGSTTSLSNMVVVAGVGSVWSNSRPAAFNRTTVGDYGRFNQLIVSNGGRVFASLLHVGLRGDNNSILVDNGSIRAFSGDGISSRPSMFVGSSGSFNGLTVTNGGVVDLFSYLRIGSEDGANSNLVLITGAGSALTAGVVNVGNNVNGVTTGNMLIVRDGGAVVASGGAVVGSQFTTSEGSTLIITNGGKLSTAAIQVSGVRSLFKVDGGALAAANTMLTSTTFSVVGLFNRAIVTNATLKSTALNVGSISAGGNTLSNSITVLADATWNVGGGVLDVGYNMSTGNVLEINGGIITNAGTTYIGYSETPTLFSYGNTLTVSNGGKLYSGDLTIGSLSGAISNTYNAGGLGTISTVSNGLITVGSSGGGTSTLNVTNVNITSTGLAIGAGSSNNTVNVADGITWLFTGGALKFGAGTGNVLNLFGNATLTNVGGIVLGGANTTLALTNASGSPARNIILGTGGSITVGETAGWGGNTLLISNQVVQTSAASSIGNGSSNNLLTILAGIAWNAGATNFTIGSGTATSNNVFTVNGGLVTNISALNFSGNAGTLLITNGGVVSASGGMNIGSAAFLSNNIVRVTGTGSSLAISNTAAATGITLGQSSSGVEGDGNQLLIENGGQVFVVGGFNIGVGTGNGSSKAIVDGAGSALYVTNVANNAKVIGGQASGSNRDTSGSDQFIIRNGGLVVFRGATDTYIGLSQGAGISSSNTMLVTDPGSIFSNAGQSVFLGNGTAGSSSNAFYIRNGGQYYGLNIGIGNVNAGSLNTVIVDGGAQGSLASTVVSNTGSVIVGNAAGSYSNFFVATNATIFGGLTIGANGSSSNSVRVLENVLWNFNGLGLVFSTGLSNSLFVAPGANNTALTNIGGVVLAGSGQSFAITNATGNRNLILGTGGSLSVGTTAGMGNNTLVISNQTYYSTAASAVGAGSSNNTLRFLGNTIWTNNQALTIGSGAATGNLVSILGGVVSNGAITVGSGGSASGNRLVVSNALVALGGNFIVGSSATSNTAQVLRGSTVNLGAKALYVGNSSASIGNTLTVDGGGVNGGAVITNAATVNDGIIVGGTYGGTAFGNSLILTNGAWLFGGGGNVVVGGLYNGGNGSSNLLKIVGGSATSVFNVGGQLSIGINYNGASTGNLVVVDGAGIAGSAVLTNATTVGIGGVDSSTFNLGNGLIVTNGGAFYSGNLVIGQIGSGNPSSLVTGNFYKIDGGAAGAVVSNGNITIGSSGTSAFSAQIYGNFMTVTNAQLKSGALTFGSGFGTGMSNNSVTVYANTLWDFQNNNISISTAGANSNLFTIVGGSVSNVNTLTVGSASGSGYLNLNGGTLSVQQLLVANNVFGAQTNSVFGNISPGATLVTSNATTALAANLVLFNNQTYSINGNWIMLGGTNLVSSTFTNVGQAAPATIAIGNGVSNATVTVGSGAVWLTGISNTNVLALQVGAGTAASNVLFINGGIVTNLNSLSIGTAAGSRSNLVVMNGGTLVTVIAGNAAGLAIGPSGTGNTMIVSNGAKVVVTATTSIGSGGNSNTLLLTGPGTVMSNNFPGGNSGQAAFMIGNASGASFNRLIISNGAALYSHQASAGESIVIGNSVGSVSNSVLVTGSGSVLSNVGAILLAGYNSGGAYNFFTVANSGTVFATYAVAGGRTGTYSSNNVITVTDTGSVMRLSGVLAAAGNTANPASLSYGNQAIISNGGMVVSVGGVISYLSTGSSNNNNAFIITGPGSVWSNTSFLSIGGAYNSFGNYVTITNGGAYYGNGTITIGTNSFSTNNSLNIVGTTVQSVLSNNGQIILGSASAGNNRIFATNALIWGGLTVGDGSSNNTVTVQDNVIWNFNTYALRFGLGTGNVVNISGNGVMTNVGGIVLAGANTIFALTNANGASRNIILGTSGSISVGDTAGWGNNTLIISNQVFRTANASQVGNGSSNNILTILTNTVWDGGGTALNIGIGQSAGNVMTVAGGVATNFGLLTLSAAANSLVVNQGGQASFSSITFVNGSTNNQVAISGTNAVLTTLSSFLNFNTTSISNSLIISNGAKFYLNGAAGYVQGNGSYNQLIVTGPGSVFTNAATGNAISFGFNPTSGGTNSFIIDNFGMVIAQVGVTLGGVAGNQLRVTSGGVLTNLGTLIVGNNGLGASAIVSNGGVVILTTSGATIGSGGAGTFASNATMLVTGAGSVLSNASGGITLGQYGSYNTLTIANSGFVYSTSGTIGSSSNMYYNTVTLTDTGSAWRVNGALTLGNLAGAGIGTNAAGNQLIVSNGAQMFSTSGTIGAGGTGAFSYSNVVIVTGPGSTWTNTGALTIASGANGNWNSLTVSNGGIYVGNGALTVGTVATANSNSLNVFGTATASVLSNNGLITVGGSGGGFNTMTVSNASLWSQGLTIGNGSSNNTVSVSGGGIWDFLAGAITIGNSAGISSATGNVLSAATYGLTNIGGINLYDSGANLTFSNRNLTTGGGINLGSPGLGGNRLTLSNQNYFATAASVIGTGSSNNILNILGNSTLSFAGGLTISANSGDLNNTVTVNGAYVRITNTAVKSTLLVGGSGQGALVLTNGTVFADEVTIGSTGGATGSVLVQNLGYLVVTNPNTLIVGSNAVGSLTVDTGGSVTDTTLIVGYETGGTGTVTFLPGSVGVFTNPASFGRMVIGQNGRGSLIMSGGTVQVNQLLVTNNILGSATNSTFTFAGGTLTTSNATSGANSIASRIIIASNNTFAINGIWNMDGGTNLTYLNVTNATGLTRIFIGNGVSNAAVNVGPNAAWYLGTASVTALDLAIGGGAATGNMLTINGGLVTNAAFVNLGTSTASFGNKLLITNGGRLFSASGKIGGQQAGTSNNAAVVTGANSLWSMSGVLNIGSISSLNSLSILNGGRVQVGGSGTLGTGGSSNSVLISGTGSVMSNLSTFTIGGLGGVGGVGNSVTVSNSAKLFVATTLVVGNDLGAAGNYLVLVNTGTVVSAGVTIGNAGSSNRVFIGDGGSWTNNGGLTIGGIGAISNALTIASGGQFTNIGSLLLGDTASTNNSIMVTDTGSVFTITGNFNIGPQTAVNLGSNGVNNVVIVANGATANAGRMYIGAGFGGVSNSLIVMGAGSVVTNNTQGSSAGLTIGGTYSGLIVSNGAIFTSSAGGGGAISISGTSNTLLVADGGVFRISGSAAASGFTFGGTRSTFTVTNGGQVLLNATPVTIGNGIGNTVLVTGAGSLLTNSAAFILGNTAADNTLTISNGGLVADATAVVGSGSTANTNSVLVTGSGSVWSNTSTLIIGDTGSVNRVTLTDGGVLYSTALTVGNTAGANSNAYNVGGGGLSSFASNGLVTIGKSGAGFNTMTVTNATLLSGALTIGNGSSNNTVTVNNLGTINLLRNMLTFGVGTGNVLAINTGGQVTNVSGIAVAGVNASYFFTNATPVQNFYLTSGGSLAVGTAGFGGNSLTISNQIYTAGAASIVGNGSSNNTLTILANTTWLNGGLGITVGTGAATGNVLTVNGGVLTNLGGTGVSGFIIGLLGSSGNTVTFSNGAGLYQGNQGQVGSSSSNNLFAVGGYGSASVVTFTNQFTIGGSGTNNALVITNATMSNVAAPITGLSNSVTVFTGGFWNVTGTLDVGSASSNNWVLVNGGVVTNSIIQVGTTGSFNWMTITNGGLMYQNAGAASALGTSTGAISNSVSVLTNSSWVMGNNPALRIGGGDYTTGNWVRVTGGTLSNASGSLTIGGLAGTSGTNAFGNFLLVENGGSAFISSVVRIGDNAGSSGNSITISNGSRFSSGNLVVGNTNAFGNTYNVGGQGNSSTVSNGTIIVGTVSSNNTMTVTNAQLWSSGLTVGQGATNNTVNVYSNASWNLLGGFIAVGAGSASKSNTLTVNGGVITNAGGMLIGTNGAMFNTLTITNALVTLNGPFEVGTLATNNSASILAGATVNLSGQSLGVGRVSLIGGSATNTLTVNGGVITNVSSIVIGGGNASFAGVGNNLIITNRGQLWSSGVVVLGNQFGANSNTITVADGGYWNLDGANFTNGAAGVTGNVLRVSGGVITNVGSLFIGSMSTSFNNQVIITGVSTVSVNQLVMTATNNTLSFLGGVLNSSGTYVTNNANFVVGDGTQVANFNALAGTHNFSTGLIVNANSWLTGVGNITAASTGIVINSGGYLSAGSGSNTIGTLTLSTVSGFNGSIIDVNINSVLGTAGVNWDFLTFNGSLTNTTAGGATFKFRLNSTNGLALITDQTSASIAIGSYTTTFSTNSFTVDTSTFGGQSGWKVVANSGTIYLQHDYTLTPDYVWGFATGDWSTGANWTNGSAPPQPGATPVLQFGTNTATAFTATNVNPYNVNVLLLNSGTTGTNVIGMKTLTFTGGVNQAGIYQQNSGAFIISNSIAVTTNIVFDGSGVGSVILASNITGSGQISKVGGASTTILQGSNTFVGPVLVNSSGTLQFANPFATGTNSITVSNGTVFVSTNAVFVVGRGISNQTVNLVGSGALWTNTATLVVGAGVASSNVFTINGGALRGGAVMIGTNGATGNSLTISNGGQIFSGNLTLGFGAGSSNNTYNVGGFGAVSTVSNGTIVVGTNSASASFNTMTVTNANLFSGGPVVIGNGAVNNVVNVLSNSTWNMLGQALSVGIGSVSGNVLTVNAGVLTNASTVALQGGTNRIVVSNGGRLFNAGNVNLDTLDGSLMMITDTGSVWSVGGQLILGQGNSKNYESVIVSNGGSLFVVSVATATNGAYNSFLVTGAGSVFTNGSLTVGSGVGGSNSLTIANGGKVVSGSSSIGNGPAGGGSFSNWVIVTDSGSVWSNVGTLILASTAAGGPSSFNRLTISNGASLYSGNVTVGSAANSSNNSYNVGGLGLVSTVSNGTITVGAANTALNTMTATNANVWSTGLTIGTGSSNNTVTVAAGVNWDMLRGQLTFGSGTGNVIVVDSTSTVTNAGGIGMLSSGMIFDLTNNILMASTVDIFTSRVYLAGGSLTVGNTAGLGNNKLTISNQQYTGSASTSIVGGGSSNNTLTILTNTLWNAGSGGLTLGSGAATGNLVLVNGGFVTNVGAVTIGAAAAGNYSNALSILNGGQWFSGNVTVNGTNVYNVGGLGARSTVSNGTIGATGGFSMMTVTNAALQSGAVTLGSAGNSNKISVLTGSTWNLLGGALTVGGANTTGNVFLIDGGGTANGAIVTNINNTGGANFISGNYNMLVVSNGGALWILSSNNDLRMGQNAVGDALIVDNGTFGSSAAGSGGTLDLAGPNNGAGGSSNNYIIVTNGGFVTLASLYVGGSGQASAGNLSTSNMLAVVGTNAAGVRATVNLNNGILAISAGGTFPNVNTTGGSNNWVTVGQGGMITNIGSITIGGNSTAANSGLVVTNGGLLYSGTVTINGSNDLYKIDGGSVGSTISNGAITIAGSGFNLMTVTNATLLSGAVQIGSGGSNNTATISANTGWNLLNASFTVGNVAAVSNTLWVDTGAISNISTLFVGFTASASSNSVTITNGGQMVAGAVVMGGSNATNNSLRVVNSGLLEANTLSNFFGGVGNTISNVSGIYQFTTGTPVIVNNTYGSIAINSGTISFRAITNADVGSTLPGTSHTLTNIAFAGNNTFQLNAATNATSGQTYTFATGNPSNFYALALINGQTAYRGGIVTIGSTGALLVSNTTATFASEVTNSGVAVFDAATTTFTTNFFNQGTITNFNDSTFLGLLTMNSGTFVTAGGVAQTQTNTINLQGTGTFDTSGGTLVLGGVVTNTGNLVKIGAGNLLVTSTNSFTGATVINFGQVVLNHGIALTNSTISLNLNDGLVFSNDTVFTIGGLAGTGNLGLTNAGGSPVTLFAGNNSSNTAYSGILSGLGSSLIKIGTGTLALANANTYTGGTIISNGVLLANNTSGSAVGGGTVTVLTNGALGGYGTVSGVVTVQPGGAMAPGSGGIGTLNVGTLTLASGAILNFEGFNYLSNDIIQVTAANGLTFGTNTFYLYQPGSLVTFDTSGKYRLIGYSGTYNGDYANLSVGNQNPTKDYTFGTNNNYITLLIKTTIGWQGNGATDLFPPDTRWSRATNWFKGNVPGNYDTIVFATTTGNYNTNDLAPNLHVDGLVFTNGADTSFILTPLGPTNSLNMVGAIENWSAYTHTINIPLVIDEQSLTVNTTNGSLIIGGTISETNGPWSLYKTGPYTLTLTTNNTYGGDTIVSNGTLAIANSLGSATSTGAVQILNGSTLSMLGGTITGSTLTVDGNVIGWGGISNVTTYTGTLLASNGQLSVVLGGNTNSGRMGTATGNSILDPQTGGQPLINIGSITMAGGTFSSTVGNITNNGTLTGFGTLDPFIVNNGTIEAGTGTLVFAQTVETAAGSINVLSNSVAQFGLLTEIVQTNTGTINIDSGTLLASQFYNTGIIAVGGLGGLISNDLINAASGFVLATNGTLVLTPVFRNFGVVTNSAAIIVSNLTAGILGSISNASVIQMVGGSLTADAITNTGTIVGSGTVTGTLENSGFVFASNGTLNLTLGTFTNPAAATIGSQSTGAVLNVQVLNFGGGQPLINLGTISASGGTVQFNGQSVFGATAGTMTNMAGGTIIGVGNVVPTVINSNGVVMAANPVSGLSVFSVGFSEFNDGTLGASNGATLNVVIGGGAGSSFNNNGTILMLGGSLLISNATPGVITNNVFVVGAGTITPAVLNPVGGTIVGSNGTINLGLLGNVNAGTIRNYDSASTVSVTNLVVVNQGTIALNGGGWTQPGNASITNQLLITGPGVIGGSVYNDVVGTIVATNGTLQIVTNLTAQFQNLGLFQITSDATGEVAHAWVNTNGTVSLLGGVLTGGAVTNRGYVTGSGTIDTAGFINETGGVISNTTGDTLEITPSWINVNGTLVMSGGLVTGGNITNNSLITGFGAIRSVVVNNSGGILTAIGGTLTLSNAPVQTGTFIVTNSGTLEVAAAWSNSGTVSMLGGTVSGGAMTNLSLITGYGTITSRLVNDNSGTLIAAFGTNTLVQAPVQTGTMIVTNTGALNVQAAWQNSGTINMAGGLLIGGALTNASGAWVRGYGSIVADMVNSGTVMANSKQAALQLNGATVVNQTSGTLGASNGLLQVAAVFTNAGTVSFLNGVGTFTSAVVNQNAWSLDPSTNVFLSDYTITTNGYLQLDNGSVSIFKGDFRNMSVRSNDFDTLAGKFIFSGGGTQGFYVAGLNLGGWDSSLQPSNEVFFSDINGTYATNNFTFLGSDAIWGYTNNYALGTLQIGEGSLSSTVELYDTFGTIWSNDNHVAGLYVENLTLLNGSLLIISNNVELYFKYTNGVTGVSVGILNPGDNVLILNGGSFHQINVVPEPSVLLLLVVGGGAIYYRTRRQRKPKKA